MKFSLVKQMAIFGLVTLLIQGQVTYGQPQGKRTRFETDDGVELHGTFYPAAKGAKPPVVMLLHRFTGESHEDGWDKLAADLQNAGYAVFSFDFRGHGASTRVDPERFWSKPANRTGVRGYRSNVLLKDQRSTIAQADFASSYVPYLINDIAAAKLHLEKENDGGTCNASNVIVIGAEEGATLGLMWMYSETLRYKMVALNMLEQKPQSKDLVGGIWLSPALKLKGISYGRHLKHYIQEVGKESEQVPMVFLYGEKNETDSKYALAMTRFLKPYYKREGKYKGQDQLTGTGDKAIEGTKLSGTKLLSEGLETHKYIAETYLEKVIRKDFALNAWEERDTDTYPFMWTDNPRTVQGGILAKANGAKQLQMVPMRLVKVRELGR